MEKRRRFTPDEKAKIVLFRRLHRGMPKVSLEVGWLSLAHNFAEEVGNRLKKESG